jgi:MFS family permease
MVPFVRDNFVLIAIAILGTNVGMALFRSPTVAYLGDLFEPRDRSKANGVINLMGGLGGALALFAGGALYKIGVLLPFIFGAAVMLLAVLVVIIFVHEPEPDQTETSDEPGLRENVRHLL